MNNMPPLIDTLEQQQISIYFIAVLLAVIMAALIPGTAALEIAINPALALMLFVTFLQVPIAELGRALKNGRFLAALLLTNFLLLPVLVTVLLPFLPSDPMVRLGALLVLLTPCIDYVVTFAHLGRADARLLLAATPTLLVVQMLFLPFYLRLFLGEKATALVQAGPFIHAFVWLIVMPLLLAGLVQLWATRHQTGTKLAMTLSYLPVPATALVLFIVVATVVPQLGVAAKYAFSVIPFYIIFALCAPLLGWGMSRLFRLESSAGRALAFSAGTRNSLVILPLALAVPGAIPILPAIILTQTLVELLSELVYIRVIGRLGAER